MTSHNRTSKAGFNLLYWYLYSSNYGSCSDQFETSKKDITVGFLNVTLQGTTTPMRLGRCVKSTWKRNAIICKSYRLVSSSERKVEDILGVWSKKMCHLKKGKGGHLELVAAACLKVWMGPRLPWCSIPFRPYASPLLFLSSLSVLLRYAFFWQVLFLDLERSGHFWKYWQTEISFP